MELFAQYLEIPAFTITSKVLYSSGVSPLPATDYLWVDTSDSTKLKVYKSIAGAYLEYPFAGNTASGSAFSETLIDGKAAIASLAPADQFLIGQINSSFSILKKITVANARQGLNNVLQVVSNSTATPVSAGAGSNVDTGLSVTITPSSSANRILVWFNQTYYMRSSAETMYGYFRVFKDATQLYGTGNPDVGGIWGGSSNTASYGVWPFLLDNIAGTTSPITYKVQGRSNVSTTFQSGAVRSSVIAVETLP